MSLGAGAVHVADDGGHASLVAHGGGKVDGLLGIILREPVVNEQLVSLSVRKRYCPQVPIARFKLMAIVLSIVPEDDELDLRLDLSPVAGRALAGKVGQRTVAGSLVL